AGHHREEYHARKQQRQCEKDTPHRSPSYPRATLAGAESRCRMKLLFRPVQSPGKRTRRGARKAHGERFEAVVPLAAQPAWSRLPRVRLDLSYRPLRMRDAVDRETAP